MVLFGVKIFIYRFLSYALVKGVFGARPNKKGLDKL